MANFTRGKLLSVTPKGQGALSGAGYTSAEPARHGSLVHEFWKRHCHRRFTQKGWTCHLEKDNVDLVCTRGRQRLHIEIETGKSDAVKNVRKSMGSNAKILSLCVDKRAYAIVKKKLEDAGLLGSERVELDLVQNLF